MVGKSLIPVEHITSAIRVIRGHRVLLDADLAELCGIGIKRLNEAVKRQRSRFPGDFMFQLSTVEASF